MKTYFCCVLMKFQNSQLLIQSQNIQGSILQLVASPGVTSLILVQSHTFIGINHEIISCHSPPSADSRRVVVSYKQKYIQKVLVKLLVKLAQEKVW